MIKSTNHNLSDRFSYYCSGSSAASVSVHFIKDYRAARMKAEMVKRGNLLFILAKHVDKKLLRRLLEDPLESYKSVP